MTRARRTVIVCAVVIAVGVALIFYCSSAQSKYDGHPASYWFDVLAAPQASVGKASTADLVNRDKAWNVLTLTSGTNAIPLVVNEFIAPDSFHARAYTWLYAHTPSAFHKILPKPQYANRRRLASRLLGAMHVEVDPYLADVLPQSSSVTRSLALNILRPRAGKHYAPYCTDFVACLSDSNAMVRADAFWILAQIGPGASNAVPHLLQIFADTNKPVDAMVAYAVWKITQRTNESVPAMRACFSKLTARNQARLGNYTAIDWLLEMEPNSPPVIEYYRAWLQEADARSRIEACSHIANRRGNASALLPDVWMLMDDTDPEVKRAALSAITKIEPKALDSGPKSLE